MAVTLLPQTSTITRPSPQCDESLGDALEEGQPTCESAADHRYV
jgi:hypothetical protein